jgi:thioredoxin 1
MIVDKGSSMVGRQFLGRWGRTMLFLTLIIAAAARPAQVEMIGRTTKADVLKAFPDWQKILEAYQPETGAIEYLHNIQMKVRVEVYWGSWCTDSQNNMGKILKILQAVENTQFETVLIAVSRDLKSPATEVEGKGIENTPTVVVFVNGIERGRIVNQPNKSYEMDLASIVSIADDSLVLDIDPNQIDREYFRTTPHSNLPIRCILCHISKRAVRPR